VKLRGSFPSTAAPLGFELTGSNGFLFSVTGQMEGLGQMQSCLVQRQLVDRRPEVQGVALGAALGVEALEDVLAQMCREGRLRVVRAAVDWTAPGKGDIVQYSKKQQQCTMSPLPFPTAKLLRPA
jgi:hypothetical protein